MTRLRMDVSLLCLCAMSLLLSGCWVFESADTGESGEDQAETAPEKPEGDTSIPPEEGGPGFEPGEGWVSVNVKPLGDPQATKGGSMHSDLPDWPKNMRIYGSASNTYFNSIMQGLLYESLCQINPHTMEFYPQLASHWKISEDQMTFTFRINPRAHWSDGTPVTADDVIATYKLLVDEGLEDPAQKEVMERLNEPRKISKYMVEVTSKERDWRNFVSFAGMSLLPAHEVGKLTGAEYLKKYNDKYTVVSGPYSVSESDIKTNEYITATRRENYWGSKEEWAKGLYNFDKIRFSTILDSRIAFDKACKGELDFKAIYTAKWWVEDLDDLEAVQKGWLIRRKVYTDYPQGFQGMAFNMRREPLDDVRVRKALAHLYDRKTMVAKFAYNEYTLQKSYYTGLAEAPENQVVEYDPQAAIQLLNEAGWTERGADGIRVKDGKRLKLTFMYRSPVFEKYLTTFKAACKEAGVEIELNLSNPETHWDNMMDRNFDIAGMAWAAVPFPYPLASWHSKMADQKKTNNITGFKNKQVDQLIETYDKEFDRDKRTELLRQMDKLIFAEHPYALDWYLPCERMIYWNKFGMPATVLPQYADWRGVFSFWWVDPSKEAALKEAREKGTALKPIPEMEVRPFDNPSTASVTP